LQLTADYKVDSGKLEDGDDVVISPLKDEDIQRNSQKVFKE
jgi:hypothetical protein